MSASIAVCFSIAPQRTTILLQNFLIFAKCTRNLAPVAKVAYVHLV